MKANVFFYSQAFNGPRDTPDDEPEPRVCRRCGWEERGEDKETYCRPDLLHDYPEAKP